MKKNSIVCLLCSLYASATWCPFGEPVSPTGSDGSGDSGFFGEPTDPSSPIDRNPSDNPETDPALRNALDEPGVFGRDYPVNPEPVEPVINTPVVKIVNPDALFTQIIEPARSLANTTQSLIPTTAGAEKLAATRFSDSASQLKTQWDGLQKTMKSGAEVDTAQLALFKTAFKTFDTRIKELQEQQNSPLLSVAAKAKIKAMLADANTLRSTIQTSTVDLVNKSLNDALKEAQSSLTALENKTVVTQDLPQAVTKVADWVRALQKDGFAQNVADAADTVLQVCSDTAALLSKSTQGTFDQATLDAMTASNKALRTIITTLQKLPDNHSFATKLTQADVAVESITLLQDVYSLKKNQSAITNGTDGVFKRLWNNLVALVKQAAGRDSTKQSVQELTTDITTVARNAQAKIQSADSDYATVLFALRNLNDVKAMVDTMQVQVDSGAFDRSTNLDLATVLKNSSGNLQNALDTVFTKLIGDKQTGLIHTLLTDKTYASLQDRLMMRLINNSTSDANYLLARFPMQVADRVIEAQEAQDPTQDQQKLLDYFKEHKQQLLASIREYNQQNEGYQMLSPYMLSPKGLQDLLVQVRMDTPPRLRKSILTMSSESFVNTLLQTGLTVKEGNVRDWHSAIAKTPPTMNVLKELVADDGTLSADMQIEIQTRKEAFIKAHEMYVNIAGLPDATPTTQVTLAE